MCQVDTPKLDVNAKRIANIFHFLSVYKYCNLQNLTPFLLCIFQYHLFQFWKKSCQEPIPLLHKWHLLLFWKYWIVLILCPTTKQAREMVTSSNGSSSETQARLERDCRSHAPSWFGNTVWAFDNFCIKTDLFQTSSSHIPHFCFPCKWQQIPACGKSPSTWAKLSRKDKEALLNGEQTEPSFLFMKVQLVLALVDYKVNMVKSWTWSTYKVWAKLYMKYLCRVIHCKQHSINYTFKGKLNNTETCPIYNILLSVMYILLTISQLEMESYNCPTCWTKVVKEERARVYIVLCVDVSNVWVVRMKAIPLNVN